MTFYVLLFLFKAYARPEYALKSNVVSCTVCHMSPTGGEIRNIYGKDYGTHGYKLSTISEKAQWFQLDYRAEAFQQNSTTGSRKGAFTMTTEPAVAIPIQTDENSKPSYYFVASYDLGRAATGLDAAYLRYSLSPSEDYSVAEHVVLGRFLPPRGLQTDEHRTFTKLATFSSMRDYETGAMLSGTPNSMIHYDLATTNGKEGDAPSQNDSPWGFYAHVRAIPFLGPFMLGASYSRLGTSQPGISIRPETYDTYGIFSFDKMSYGKVPLDLIYEVELARGWDNSIINGTGMSYFVPSTDTAWQSALNNSTSRSFLFQANWWLNQQWKLLYRLEQFIPDINFGDDKFYRFGYGVEWFFNGQSSLQARFERGFSTRPGVTEDGTARAVGYDTFVFFHFWL